MKLTLDPPGFAGAAGSVPLSVRIRERLMSAGHRFHANDNIAAYLRDGELDLLQAEVEERLQAVLRALVIDVEQDHNSRETARRVAKMFVREVFAGRYVEAPEVTAFPNAERLNELLVVGPLRVRSACSHHLCPVMGRAWVGVMPHKDSQLIGLSKYARLIDWVMALARYEGRRVAHGEQRDARRVSDRSQFAARVSCAAARPPRRMSVQSPKETSP
jgi:GTP cyclohydrolase I